MQPTDFKGTPETTLAQVREFLNRVGLKEVMAVEEDESNYLLLPSGARITFDGQKLWSINIATPAPAPTRKQIAVSLSAATWNKLRIRAQQSHQSVAELCAEWITQRANELQRDQVDGAGQRG